MSASPYAVIHIGPHYQSDSPRLVLRGLTITSDGGPQAGVKMDVDFADLTVEDCAFLDNTGQQ